MLGHTLLVAENWQDPSDSLPFVGPSRYTAHHYTRGGLLDMMVAIIPTDDTAAITPSNIVWNDGDDTTDFAAGNPTVLNADVQATRFLCGADVLNESDHGDVSDAPNLVKAIHYPNKDTGAPDAGDALTLKYTIGGKVAQRTDQRGVTLDFYYGECPDCAAGTVGIPHDALAEVAVAYLCLPFIPYSLSANDLRIDASDGQVTLSCCDIKGWSVSWLGYGWLCCL